MKQQLYDDPTMIRAEIRIRQKHISFFRWAVRWAETTIAVCTLACMTAMTHADSIDEALAHPDRPEGDLERDATSNPAAILSFIELSEGAVVLDLFAGGGYYSEIVSRAVGTDGTVYLHNNDAYLGITGDAVVERLRGDRLTNVVRLDREVDAMDLPVSSVDVVLMVMTYHDLYFKTDTWTIDPDQFFTMVHGILKPGGIFVVVDHVAVEGSGSSAAQELHRIDPVFARQDIEARGFTFKESSDVLLNAEDPLDISVFDPGIRRKTSRFVYKFVESSP